MANGKEVPRLDFTSSTTPGQQIHKFDHTRTANPCDWLPCRRAALPLVGCPHSLVYLHLPVVEGLIICISATPIWEPPSHYSMLWSQILRQQGLPVWSVLAVAVSWCRCSCVRRYCVTCYHKSCSNFLGAAPHHPSGLVTVA